MRGGALAALAALVGLLLLGLATATWHEITIPTPSVDGVQLPDEVRAVTGAEGSPLAVLAAVPAFAAALPLALLGAGDRVGTARGTRTAGTVLRAAASLLGGAALALAAAAQVAAASVDVPAVAAAGGGPAASAAATAVPLLHLLAGALAAVVGLLAWRVPRQPLAAEASRFTVEAAQAGGVAGAPAADVGEDADEWDLAVAPEGEGLAPRPVDPADPAVDPAAPGDPAPTRRSGGPDGGGSSA